jgi:hypothetical protein
MSIRIELFPSSEGWALKSPVLREPVFFRSGRAAEDEARALAARLVRAGQTAELVVTLRDGSLGGRLAFP